MAASEAFVAFVTEQLAPLGPVTIKRFFGGRGLWLEGIFFAFVVGDALYFKVDDTTRPNFAREGCEPFSYETKTGTQTIPGYWQAPERLFDDAEELLAFAHDAIAVSRCAKMKVQPAAKPKPRKAETAQSDARNGAIESTRKRTKRGSRKI